VRNYDFIIKDVIMENFPDLPTEQLGNYMAAGRYHIDHLCPPHRTPLPESEIRIALRELFKSEPVDPDAEEEAAFNSMELQRALAYLETKLRGAPDDVLEFEAAVLASDIIDLRKAGRWPKDKELADQMRQWIYRKRWRRI